jgi:hypothetical protein
MSRTVRRKHTNLKRHSYADEKWFTHDRYREWTWDGVDGRYRIIDKGWIKKEGKDFKKGWWRFHSDRLLSFCNYRSTWGEVRAKNRTDLNEWVKCEDHEPIFYEEVNKRDWSD